jgi:large subunit ribosomal protein L14e
MEKSNQPKLGQIAKVISGTDLDKYVMVVAIIDSKFVMIADGKKRKFDRPKKKNILHLQLQNSISQVVLESLEQSGRVTNGKLRFALTSFIDKLKTEVNQKGD